MKPLHASRHVAAPPTVVWGVLVDLSRRVQTIRSLQGLEIVHGDHRMSVGSRWRETRNIAIRERVAELYVTEVVEEELLVVESDIGPMHVRHTFTLLGAGGGTELTSELQRHVDASAGVRALATALDPLATTVIRVSLREELDDLAAAAEASP